MLLSSLTSNTLSVPSELGSSLLSGGSESSLLPAAIFCLWDSTAARFCSSRSRLYSSASRWRRSRLFLSKFSVVLSCFCRFPPLFYVFSDFSCTVCPCCCCPLLVYRWPHKFVGRTEVFGWYLAELELVWEKLLRGKDQQGGGTSNSFFLQWSRKISMGGLREGFWWQQRGRREQCERLD